MSLAGLDSPAVVEAHQAASAEPSGWYERFQMGGLQANRTMQVSAQICCWDPRHHRAAQQRLQWHSGEQKRRRDI